MKNVIVPGVATVLFVFLAGMATIPAQEITDQRFEFKPSITLQEKYTSNANLTAANKKEDYITMATPGFTFTGNNATFGVNIGANLSYNAYAINNQYDYVSYNGNIGLRYNPDPTLTFNITDRIIRSEDPRQVDLADTSTTPQYTGVVQRERSIYLMNRVEPSVNWQFTRDGNLGFSYVNDIYRNENKTLNENTTDTFTPRFNYWFDQQNGIILDYSYTKGNNSIQPDLQGHAYHGRYTYKFSPRSSIFADYSFAQRDYEAPGISYNTHSPSVGIDYAFSATLTGLLQLGYYYSDPSQGNSNSGFSGTIKLTRTDQLTTYSIKLETGYKESFSGVQGTNENFAQNYGATITINHKLTERFNVDLTASANQRDYVYADRKDRLYTADLNASYQILKWLFLFGKVGYWWQDSPLYPTDRYDEYHAIVGLTATYL